MPLKSYQGYRVWGMRKRKPFIWEGHSPFTIGEADEDGNVIRERTFQPGEEIPKEWLALVRESLKEGVGPLEVDNKGHHDPRLVKEEFKKLSEGKRNLTIDPKKR